VGTPPRPLAQLAGLAESRPDGLTGQGPGITGVSLRSDAVRPGDVFAARPGSTAHGATFAAAAARAGAVAVLTDQAGLALLRAQPAAAELPALVTERPRAVLGKVAAAVYGDPSGRVEVIGVTGTSGKTTTCYLIEGALAAAGRRTGLIGTVAARIDGQVLPSMLTTPEAPDLQALFAVMAQRGVQSVAMEVSSHALAQGRVSGTAFAVGAFTNLSQDHLDFHHDMESYFAAKRLLFDGRARTEVVVVDDDYGRRLAADRPAAVTVSGTPGAAADWTARTEPAPAGVQQLQVTGPGGMHFPARIALPGPFNVSNALTALACVHAAGVDPVRAAGGLAGVVVPGRMERVDAGQPFLALVDYAHKPAALAAVLEAIRPGLTGRVIVVFGAGGDRDRGKRPMMGAEAARRAELVIVTDDNPRSEDPAAIRAEVLGGARSVAGGQVLEIGDRREAITAAVRAARPGDAVLIAGKGHEHGQEIAGVVHPFSDREELAAALALVSR
jgi:UDP-N-acetylmuramoyl-L-alanyl-D-glutamate--2,6-diaminopimelate ligase